VFSICEDIIAKIIKIFVDIWKCLCYNKICVYVNAKLIIKEKDYDKKNLFTRNSAALGSGYGICKGRFGKQ